MVNKMLQEKFFFRKSIGYIKLVFVRLRSVMWVIWYRTYYGIEFGKGVRINSKLNIYGYGKIYIGEKTCFGSVVTLGTTNEKAIIRIGKECFINGTVICAAELVDVGDYCITSDCDIMDTSSHGIEPNRRNDKSAIKVSPIYIHDNVWIGSKVLVLPGVQIGKNSIIGVNSVVSKSISENVFAAGVPAKIIKEL